MESCQDLVEDNNPVCVPVGRDRCRDDGNYLAGHDNEHGRPQHGRGGPCHRHDNDDVYREDIDCLDRFLFFFFFFFAMARLLL